ncbi:hypothetical protein [Roseovarius pacificus]|uniref:DUF883 family protein n=1 Tax=Roseovarius pacificus TaxID=337701 RepID=UPI002A188F46|nr:hypothetical protein [Roseovarius pacificus]
MAQAKSNSSQNDIEQLSEQISTLRADIATISETLYDLGRSSGDAAIDGARRKAADLRDEGERQLRAARHHAEDMGQQATDAVRAQPAAAVGIAVGVGFLLGFMTGRK